MSERDPSALVQEAVRKRISRSRWFARSVFGTGIALGGAFGPVASSQEVANISPYVVLSTMGAMYIETTLCRERCSSLVSGYQRSHDLSDGRDRLVVRLDRAQEMQWSSEHDKDAEEPTDANIVNPIFTALAPTFSGVGGLIVAEAAANAHSLPYELAHNSSEVTNIALGSGLIAVGAGVLYLHERLLLTRIEQSCIQRLKNMDSGVEFETTL